MNSYYDNELKLLLGCVFLIPLNRNVKAQMSKEAIVTLTQLISKVNVKHACISLQRASAKVEPWNISL